MGLADKLSLHTKMGNITVLVHTYKRPECAKRLIESVPDGVPVLVYDDSNADKGLSWGRNYLVSKAKTKYVIILDDDCFFEKDLDFDRLEKEMDDGGYDMMELRSHVNYRGYYEVDGEIVRCVPSDERLEYIANIFIAKTDTLKKFKWDESLKMGEHFAFFFTHRGNFKLGISEFMVEHDHKNSEEYQKGRDRAIDFLREFMKKNNIKRIYGDEVVDAL